VLRLATRGEHATHVMVGGVANLADEAQLWRRETVRRLFEALEREQEMLQVLQDVSAGDADLSVTIGAEHPTTGDWGASIVTAPFRSGDATLGTIGVVGPTRMDYVSAMASVRAVAKRLTELATELDQ
jgi:heat-inducible transcriptional repressor